MKRIALAIILTTLLLSACTETVPDGEVTEEATETVVTTETTIRTIIWGTNPDTGLPVYEPGIMKVASLEELQDNENTRGSIMRAIYYTISQQYESLLPEGRSLTELFEKKRTDDEDDQMALVRFVKFFNIPKEEFEKIVELDLASARRNNIDLTDESNEIPNADIIYTFDNDIINEFYRRE